MIHLSSDSPLFILPHCNSMWSCYQDDSFGNYIQASGAVATQVILFITEDLH